MKSEHLPSRNLVLLGVGHTNAHIVRMWAMQPFPDTSLTCISDFPIATYSGMLPAVLAQQVPREMMEIDLVRLCNSVGARLILGRATGIDHGKQLIRFEDRPPVPFDVLSIGIGSVPTVGEVEIDHDSVLKIKPMQTFLERLKLRLDAVRESSSTDRPLRVVVVGSGVAGIEIACCIQPFLRAQGFQESTIELVTRSANILPEVIPSTRQRVLRVLKQRGFTVLTNSAVQQVTNGEVLIAGNQRIPADLVIWATGASSPPALSQFELPVDGRGFIATDSTLRSVSGAPIFAVGDSGTIASESLPKAGVYAVRQGPILWENLQHCLAGTPLRPYKPQRSFLKLINLGDGRAVGQWMNFAFAGRWAYWLKDRIDSKFIEKYQPASMADETAPMQCRGCGCKLGATALEAAVGFQRGQGGPALEDAAEIGGDSGSQLVASTDFFTSPFNDAYLTGRIAAIHSASDILASGAQVTEALANVVLPEGDPTAQQQMLSDFLDGARREFDSYGAKIVGGHTIVGPRMEVGFTVIGSKVNGQRFAKGNLRPGDRLYLTKPIGVGALLAAHMRSACRANDFLHLVESMLNRQCELSRIASEAGVTACTDITGFGLVGHLVEMLQASHMKATLKLADIPLLVGATEAVKQGIESSLIAENFRADRFVSADARIKQSPAYRLMFDPQTCGGLLFGIPRESETSFLDQAHRLTEEHPLHCIGEICDPAQLANMQNDLLMRFE